MVEGRTTTGFKFKADKEALTEFLELFADVQAGDSLKVFKLIELTLGKEQKKRLYEHCRNEAGRVPADRLSEEIGEIFEALGKAEETKN